MEGFDEFVEAETPRLLTPASAPTELDGELEARLSAAAGIPVTVRAEAALNGERRPEA